MQDRFKYRAIVKGYYCLDTPENYEEFEPTIFLKDVDVLSNGEIGIIEDKLEIAIREQHPNIDSVDIGYILKNFRNDGCGIDDYVTITPEVVYQCTGLKDKHGKLIYEGDILNIEPNSRLKVIWDNKYARFLLAGLEHKYFVTTYNLVSLKNTFEIIGNIYENPEPLNDNQKRAENLITNPESEILDSIKRAKIKTDICKTIKELIDNE